MVALYGSIEAGGTKFVCAVGTGPSDLEEVRFETTTPEETLARAAACLKKLAGKRELKSIGIGSFGPIDLELSSKTYGRITSTPKPGWSNMDVVGMFKRDFDVPIGFDTDVNAAALGEHAWGAARGLSDFVYLTIGTGIGGGGMANGKLMRGLMHPEMGHAFLPKRKDDSYGGRCNFHGDKCFEGLASGPAMEERWGESPKNMRESHPAWDLEAHYAATALVNFICTLSPRRIIIGGGVMEKKLLFPLIRRKVSDMLNHYISPLDNPESAEAFIVPPGLGDRAGILGAIALAKVECGDEI
jgi:fructokinase